MATNRKSTGGLNITGRVLIARSRASQAKSLKSLCDVPVRKKTFHNINRLQVYGKHTILLRISFRAIEQSFSLIFLKMENNVFKNFSLLRLQEKQM